MFKNQIKCVIWDLDETLWAGSLAEGDEIVPKQQIVKLIKELDQKGIINSICSKNNITEAKRTLENIGLWDYFVFPVIDFVPKGQSVKAIIEKLQLQIPNVLFVDDNIGNRNEVLHYCKDIMVADVHDEDFFPEMVNVAKQTQGKSRLAQYKVLEKKNQDKQQYADNTSFLKDSNITVCMLRNPADLIFKQRIYDMANRTNQLNFTKSRFSTMEELENYLESQSSVYIHHGAVFVYDKYGDYGLVGFYAFDERREKRKLAHFLFSCRIMNMGVEQAVYHYLRTAFGVKPFALIEKTVNMDFKFIRIIHQIDDRLRLYIDNEMDVPDHYKTLISAGCNSGIISHYLSDAMHPVSFELFSITNNNSPSNDTENIIYGIFGDYINPPWKSVGGFSYARFKAHLNDFLNSCKNKRIFLILASEKYDSIISHDAKGIYMKLKHIAIAVLHGNNRLRFRKCNAIVREIAQDHPNVSCIETSEYVQNKDEQYDSRHFDRIVIKRICEYICGMVS